MKEFLKSIEYGHDGVIQKIEFISDKKVTIIISTEMEKPDNWVNVAFYLDGLREFTVKQTSTSVIVVLFSGITYMSKNHIHYIDFSPNGLPEDEVKDADEFRLSDLYFAADRITYEVLPYKEDY